VFLDETSAATNMARRFGWTQRGECCRLAAPFGHYKTTITAAVRYARAVRDRAVGRSHGRQAPLQLRHRDPNPGAAGGRHRRHGQPASRQVAGVRAAIEPKGARLLYLPSYSPDLNPIEQAFAKLKALLRRAAARTIPELWAAIRQAFTCFTPHKCRNYLAAAGYENDLAVATWTGTALESCLIGLVR